MNKPTLVCEHEQVDEYGICAACGALSRPFSYSLYVMRAALLEFEKERGELSDEEYKKKRAKLDYIKDYSITHKLWHPLTFGSPE